VTRDIKLEINDNVKHLVCRAELSDRHGSGSIGGQVGVWVGGTHTWGRLTCGITREVVEILVAMDDRRQNCTMRAKLSAHWGRGRLRVVLKDTNPLARD